MRKMTYILLPLFLLVGLFIPISCEDAADDLAAALSGGDATLTGTWTVTGYQDKSGENCETTDESSTLFNGGTAVFTTTGLTMNTPMNVGVEAFCTLFFQGTVDGNTCIDPAECDCDEATSEDCDQSATTESACTNSGGEWDEEVTTDMTDADFVAFLSSACVDESGPCGGGIFNSATSTCVACDEDRTYVIEIVDSMTLTMTDDEGTDTATYSISGNNLTLTISGTSDDGENECSEWTFTKN